MRSRLVILERKMVRKRAKNSDAVMTGILVTKYKMGQIYIEDLEKMVADASRPERCSAAKKVMEALKGSPDLPRRQNVLPVSDFLHQKR